MQPKHPRNSTTRDHGHPSRTKVPKSKKALRRALKGAGRQEDKMAIRAGEQDGEP